MVVLIFVISEISAQNEPENLATENAPIDSVNTQIEVGVCSTDNLSKRLNSEDLFALESEILQLNGSMEQTTENKTDTTALFGANDDIEIGESQLMELCSGSFATQKPEETSKEKVIEKKMEMTVL